MKISKKRLKQIIAEELSLLEAEEPKEEKPEKKGPASTQEMIDKLHTLLSKVTLSDAERNMYHAMMEAMAEAANESDIASDPKVRTRYQNLLNALRQNLKKTTKGEE